MKVSILQQQHPTRDAEAITRYRALAEGGARWHALVETWLPRASQEPDLVWAERKARATYHNYAGGICSMLGAYLFSEAPHVEGLDSYDGFVGNCDDRGTPWGRWWHERFRDALVGKQALCWVNLPARDGVVVDNRADEERSGLLDAYLVPITPEELLDWGQDNRGALTWVLFRQSISDRAGLEAVRAPYLRWTYIDHDVVRQFEWHPLPNQSEPKDDDEATEVRNVQHRIGTLPVVALDLPDELWAMALLADPAIAQMRARNDHSWALYRAAHALLAIYRKWDGDVPVLAPGGYFQLERDDAAEYLEPGGQSFAILAQDVKDLREEIYRILQHMALSQDNASNRQASSGASKQSDWQAVDIILSAYAEIVLGAMRDVAKLVAKIRAIEPETITVKGLDGWQSMSLTDFFTTVALATGASKLSPTFRREVAKREAERLLPELDADTMDAIRDEIDESPDDESAGMFGPTIGTMPSTPGAPPPEPSANPAAMPGANSLPPAKPKRKKPKRP